MKIVIVLLAFLVANGGNAVPIQEEEPQMEEPKNEKIFPSSSIFDNILAEYVRQGLKAHEPFNIPDILELPIKDLGLELNIQFKNSKVSETSEFTLDYFEKNLWELWAKFLVTLPRLHLEGDYIVSGVIQDKKVDSQGKFSIDLMEFELKGYAKAKSEHRQIQVETIYLDFDFQDHKFDLIGFTVDGMAQQELDGILHKKFGEYLQENRKDMSTIFAERTKEKANKFVAGKSLLEIMNQVVTGQNLDFRN